MNFKKYLNEKYSIKPVEDASQFDTVLSININITEINIMEYYYEF